MTKLVFTLPLPPSVNNLFPTSRTGHRFISDRYKSWLDRAAVALLSGGQPRQRVCGPVRVLYEFSFSDRRRRDIFNYEKAVSDFLVKQGLIEDDEHIQEGTVRRLSGEDWYGVRVSVEGIE